MSTFSKSILKALALVAIGFGLTVDAATAQSSGQLQLYQEMLVWTGDYDGMIDGKLGDGTIGAIRSFQSRLGHVPTGSLSEQEKFILIRQGSANKQAVGFTIYRDEDTGVAVGIPGQLVSRPQKSKWGTSWAARDDRINIDTLHVTGMTLRELFDKLSSFRNRRVDYSVLRDDWFVISGVDVDGAAVYVRAAADAAGDDIRGFSVRITRDWREQLGAIPVAMSSSFEVLPHAVANVPATPTVPRLPPNPLPDPPQRVAKDINPCFNGLGNCPVAFSGR